MFLHGDKRWVPESTLHSRWGSKNKYFYFDYDPSQREALLNDAKVFKTTVFRHPASRLVSAYLDKVVPHNGVQWARKYGIPATATFEWFVRWLYDCTFNPSKASHSCRGSADPLWLPQTKWCGHPELLKVYTHIALFEMLGHDGNAILDQAGLRQSVQQWGASGKEQVFGDNSSKEHATNADEKVRNFVTPEVERMIEKIYARDLEIWRTVAGCGK
eukprot:m.237696 g.237696  ORF g.237696 m.237696 type:complete len:216 (+) comp10910_c0_seq1:1750-2397(+)